MTYGEMHHVNNRRDQGSGILNEVWPKVWEYEYIYIFERGSKIFTRF